LDIVKLTINGQEITADKGMTVLEAAQSAGIYIPKLCYDPDLKPYGACRLCVVEIENIRGLPTACTTPVSDGMVVHTETPAVSEVRRTAVQLLMTDHPCDCLICHRREQCQPFDICLRSVAVTDRCVTCPKNGQCELQEVIDYLGITELPFSRTTRSFPVDTSNPFFNLDRNKCILCGRCVRTCNEITGVGAIDFAFRGYSSRVSTFGDKPLVDSTCQSCGECVVHCPVAALMPKDTTQPVREVATTCPYCGVGCQIYLGTRDNRVVTVRGNKDKPPNNGHLCVKGRFGITGFIHHPERLTTPLIKKNGELTQATWDEALGLIAGRLDKYNGDEVGVIASAKCTNEENYIIQKFARVVLGTNNIDHSARLCDAPTLAGLGQSFGSGAMTNPINEIHNARGILAIGTNTTEAHPIIGLEVKRAVRSGAKLIVANPREIDLVRFAEIWLRQRPGTDVALLMGMMRVIVDEGLLDPTFISERCENFDAFKASLSSFGLDRVERITGVPRDLITDAARVYASSKPATILYGSGITQHCHGTDNVIATANLAMLTGNIGKPSTGVNPLRGQNNAQGACDLGALPDAYPGAQSVTDPSTRQRFEAAWECPLPSFPGLTLTEMLDSASKEKLKAIYLVGENPLLSNPDTKHTRKALEKLEFLVVQDIFLTETARLADVVLPGATFAEKDGTFTNTERRVQRVRKAIEPTGNSRPDWWITCALGQRIKGKGFDFEHPSRIMDEIASLTPGYGGISFERLENGGLQLPSPTPDHPGTPILHTSAFTRGKGQFIPLDYKPPAELPDDDYPLILTTGRSLYHFNTGTLTGKVTGLNALQDKELVKINPGDARALGIDDNDMVKVISRRGEVTARTEVSETSPAGVIFMAFHLAKSPVNMLTSPALDPVARVPELKLCAVRVERVPPGV